MNVVDLANTVCDELKLENVKYNFTGGSRGWKGDAPLVHLDISKLQKLGWKPKTPIEEGVRKTVKYLMENPEAFERDVGGK